MKIIQIIIVFLLPAAMACKIDHGLEPVSSRISGTVSFTGNFPADTDQIRVAVAETFPPKDIKELTFSNALPLGQPQAEYEIFLPPSTYEVIAVFWKGKNEPWNISDVVGVYGGTFVGDFLIPTFQPVTLPDGSASVENIDIQTNLNKVNRDATIEGTLTFNGAWPDNTGLVGIGAFIEVPEAGNTIDYYFKNIALDYSVPADVSSHQYKLRVRSGEIIQYIAVLWINDNYDLSSITDLGFYPDAADPQNPGSVTVDPGGTVTGIDITINFQ
jgi:hypothetical protein